MKVAVLIMSFDIAPYTPGGIGTVSLEHVRFYKKKGFDVCVLGPKKSNIVFPVTGIQYFGLPLKGNLRKLFLCCFHLPFILIKYRIAFVVAIQGTYAGILASLIKILFRIPFFVLAHGNDFIRFQKSALIKFLLKKIFCYSNCVFSNSKFIKTKLIQFGVSESKIETIFCGVDTEAFQLADSREIARFYKKFGISDDDFLLITVSRLDKRKGHIETLKAIKHIKDNSPEVGERIRYIIVGNGPNLSSIAAEISTNKLSRQVELAGYIKSEELAIYLSAADAFIMPNKYLENDGSIEGFGIVFLEAAACGTCSIGGKSGGTSDAIVDGKTGFLVDGNDPLCIAEKIELLATDPTLRERLSNTAHERARKDFGWDRILHNELRIIDKKRKATEAV